MPSLEKLVSVLSDRDACHFPRLVFERISSPVDETLFSRLSLPKLSASEDVPPDRSEVADLCKIAFALLLKAYTRSDNASYGLLSHREPVTETGYKWPKAYYVKTDLDMATSPSQNLRKLTSIPLAGADGEIVSDHFRKHAFKEGCSLFNTTLQLTCRGVDEQTPENPLDSDLILRVELDTSQDNTSEDGLQAILHYRTSLLDKWCARNVLFTFESILKSIAINMNSSLQDVSLFSAYDEQIIRNWNARLPPPARQTLNEHSAKTFQDNVDKEVVYTTDGCFTYGELDDLSTILAVRLLKLGLKRNMIVPIFMNKSRWVTCAMAAVWKAGGAVTTMDPSYPDDRLFAIMEEVKASIVISDTTHAARFQKDGVHIISDLEELPRLHETSGVPVARHDAWRMADVKPDDLLFVAFTSGSTGRPKGVMHTHNRLTSEHQSYIWNVEYNGGARILQFGSYAYIAGVGENARTFLHGATLCVPSESERTSNLAEFINRSRATRCYLTPSIIRTLDPAAVPSLQNVCVGGEALDRNLEDQWGGRVNFIQIYGASEGGFLIKEKTNPQYYGKGLFPVGGLSWIVDPLDVNKLVPIGAVGEIVFESHELATGYLNDPEKTAKTFINPPMWAKERAAATGCRYLRMGDLGRYEIDGSVSIYGRADTQVKINGQRVELGDIESNLRQILPPRSEAIVELVKPFDAPERPLLTAFCRLPLQIATNGDSDPDSEARTILSDARKRLEKLLPRHMIPRVFIFAKELPQSYKTDRKKLRTEAGNLGYRSLLAASLGVGEKIVEPPATAKERTLAKLWATLLGQDVQSIGRKSDFLASGGDSLAAIRLVSAARSENLGLTTQNILTCSVLEDMAALATVLEVAESSPGIAMDTNSFESTSDGTTTVQATDFQEWAVLVGALNGGWIDHLVYDFHGHLDVKQLKKSCKSLVESHPIFRTIFRLINDRVYMEISPEKHVPFEVHETTLEDLAIRSNQIYAARRITPLGVQIVRFDLVKASSTRHRLIMRLSHAQYDGFCAHVIGEHLRLLYLSQPISRMLPFHEYAKAIQDPRLIHNAETYWRDRLRGSQMPNLVRRDRSGPPYNNTLDGEFKKSVVEPNLRRHGTSTAAIVKAAWALTIAALSQSSDVVFGDFIAGRQLPIPHIETVVGPCVNFMPVRVKVSEDLTNIQLLRAIQTDLVASIPHESLGFKHIIQRCTEWGAHARFSSIVNFVNVDAGAEGTDTWTEDSGEDESSSRLTVRSLYEEQQHDKTDLWLLCLPGHLAWDRHAAATKGTQKTLELYFRYSTRVYQTSAIERIATLYCDAFNALASVPDAPVTIPRVTDEERQFLVPASS